MGKTTIEWVSTVDVNGTVHPGYTFNPWIGCAKISAGCQHCYAETLMGKRLGRVQWGPNGTRQRTSDEYWRQPFKWNRQAKAAGVRQRVFCASLADVFEDRPELRPWRDDLLAMIVFTPYLDWLLLTKRPENVMEMLPPGWTSVCSSRPERADRIPDNVWIGTSVEDQEQANKRIPHLLRIPARVLFLSVEPLLNKISLRHIPAFDVGGEMDVLRGIDIKLGCHLARKIAWVIVGGESGHGARPMHPDWARSIRDQCQAAGVPFFMKQMGGMKKPFLPIPDDLMIREFPR